MIEQKNLNVIRRAFLAITLIFFTVFSMNAAYAQMKEINFGVISTESSKNLKTIWEPFVDDMSKQTGMKVNAYFVTDYAAVIEGMKFNKVQLAWYGGKAAMEAVDRANGEVFAQVVNLDGAKGYYSHIVANKDSKLNNVNDMLNNAKDLTFANGDPNSTSGFLVPGYYVFALNNADPNKVFKRVITGNHESNALGVAAKQVDVGTTNSEIMERLKVTNPDRRELIKIIWTSQLIPSDPLVWRKDLDEKTKKAITDFILNYGKDEKEQQILKALQWQGFKASSNSQLIPIRQLELFKEKNKIQNDAKMSDNDRQKATADIDAKLKALEK